MPKNYWVIVIKVHSGTLSGSGMVESPPCLAEVCLLSNFLSRLSMICWDCWLLHETLSNQCFFLFDCSWSFSWDDTGSCSVGTSSALGSSEDIKCTVRTGHTFSFVASSSCSVWDLWKRALKTAWDPYEKRTRIKSYPSSGIQYVVFTAFNSN